MQRTIIILEDEQGNDVASEVVTTTESSLNAAVIDLLKSEWELSAGCKIRIESQWV